MAIQHGESMLATKINTSDYEKVKEIAALEQRSISAVVRIAMSEYIARNYAPDARKSA